MTLTDIGFRHCSTHFYAEANEEVEIAIRVRESQTPRSHLLEKSKKCRHEEFCSGLAFMGETLHGYEQL